MRLPYGLNEHPPGGRDSTPSVARNACRSSSSRAGGRIYERSHDGQEHDWGEVTVWDPPHRLAYKWRIATDRANATDVEIRFFEIGPDATRIEIEHGGWDRLGPEFGPAWRETNQGGWDGTLPAYIAACAA